ncbi:Mitogen-activated protein kinase kinase 2 [Neolecta irregularis DAH-3]|uniref:non-specific serine/threonine protein kinase n=1 Tax=Neolecta irregularis (strain DAH-3) TaxID=1198029 RepID=A0A1U7LHL6_NEOID|nr:Mitogen-activated protein kinase kinase 2 [Neolecta irregularis DAH-3]|eukprot:OLL22042.1 Mitogen-activated protein kinase kinase 2 [Neolecta irregularis DAH-3]
MCYRLLHALLILFAFSASVQSSALGKQVFVTDEPESQAVLGFYNITMDTEHNLGERFKFIKYLNRGAEASASLYMDNVAKSKVVIKLMSTKNQDVWTTDGKPMEILVARHFQHPGLIKIQETFFVENKGYWGLVIPWMEFGALSSFSTLIHLLEIPPSDVDRFFRARFRNALQGLAFLHSKVKFCHNDVKGSNILVSGDLEFDLADYGRSIPIDSMFWDRFPMDCKVSDAKSMIRAYLILLGFGTTLDLFDDDSHEYSEIINMYWDLKGSSLKTILAHPFWKNAPPETHPPEDFIKELYLGQAQLKNDKRLKRLWSPDYESESCLELHCEESQG